MDSHRFKRNPNPNGLLSIAALTLGYNKINIKFTSSSSEKK